MRHFYFPNVKWTPDSRATPHELNYAPKRLEMLSRPHVLPFFLLGRINQVGRQGCEFQLLRPPASCMTQAKFLNFSVSFLIFSFFPVKM